MTRQLITARTRRHFREALVDTVLGEIRDLFEDEGFRERDTDFNGSGARRTLVERYYADVRWDDPSSVHRVLRVFEQVLSTLPEGGYRDQAVMLLRSDGYVVADGRIAPRVAATIPVQAMAELDDPDVIEAHLRRIASHIDDDPELAIGAAKELIESTTKLVLKRLNVPFDERADVPALVKQAQQALKLHASDVDENVKASKTIRSILSGLSQVAVGVAELRNHYGTGHGRSGRTGLNPRHAHLAVGAATVYCRTLLETLAARTGSGADLALQRPDRQSGPSEP